MPLRKRQTGVEIRLRATPKSSRDAFDGLYEDGEGQKSLRAYVRAVPEKGKANKALIKLLGSQTGLARSAMTVIAGAHSRTKVILIEGEPDDIYAQLSAWLKELK